MLQPRDLKLPVKLDSFIKFGSLLQRGVKELFEVLCSSSASQLFQNDKGKWRDIFRSANEAIRLVTLPLFSY